MAQMATLKLTYEKVRSAFRERRPWLSAALAFACCLPAAWIGLQLPSKTPFDVVPFLLHYSGQWSLMLLAITLCCTLLRRIFGWHWALARRRMIGLFCFAYACLHMLSYVWIGQKGNLHLMREDVSERPHIWFGTAAYALLVLLAVTSPYTVQRRLGPRRWQRLHYAIYVIALLSVVHCYLGKAYNREAQPWLLLGWVISLLLWRLIITVRRASPR